MGKQLPAEKIIIKMIPTKIATEAMLMITIGMIFVEINSDLDFIVLVALLTKNGWTFEDCILEIGI